MISRAHRIPQALFKASMRKSRLLDAPLLSLRYAPSKDTTRFAFVAPKSAVKSAVGRNTLRRRGYSAIEKLNPKPLQPQLFFFFFKKIKEAKKLPSYQTIYEHVSTLLKKTGTL